MVSERQALRSLDVDLDGSYSAELASGAATAEGAAARGSSAVAKLLEAALGVATASSADGDEVMCRGQEAGGTSKSEVGGTR